MISLFTIHIANALTLLRIVIAPVAGLCLWLGGASPLPDPMSGRDILHDWTLAAFILILVAALTDWLDGLAARAFNTHSRLGRLLDPLADKILCWCLLLAFAAASAWSPAIVLPSLLILIRDLSVTVKRLTASDGEGPRPTRLAKLKTALELAVLTSGPLLALIGTEPVWSVLWLAGLALCAALSVWTGLLYFVKS